jgi:hypothetical protein
MVVQKPEGKTAYVIGEEGENVIAVMRPRMVVIPLWELRADLLEGDTLVGWDAVKMIWAVRDRMLALIDSSNFLHDLNGGGEGKGPVGSQLNLAGPPEGTEWYVNDIDDAHSRDRGIVYDSPPPRSLFRYACGRGKVGRWVSGPTFSGLCLFEGETSVVAPRTCRACRSLLRPENLRVADGCLCNSPRGVNHGLVPTDICTCPECDPAQTGGTRYPVISGP